MGDRKAPRRIEDLIPQVRPSKPWPPPPPPRPQRALVLATEFPLYSGDGKTIRVRAYDDAGEIKLAEFVTDVGGAKSLRDALTAMIQSIEEGDEC